MLHSYYHEVLTAYIWSFNDRQCIVNVFPNNYVTCSFNTCIVSRHCVHPMNNNDSDINAASGQRLALTAVEQCCDHSVKGCNR
jgi:hypothetical protein